MSKIYGSGKTSSALVAACSASRQNHRHVLLPLKKLLISQPSINEKQKIKQQSTTIRGLKNLLHSVCKRLLQNSAQVTTCNTTHC